MPRLTRLFAVIAVMTLCGCSPVYVLKSWNGQRRLMSKRKPIVELLVDPSVPEPLKAKLRLSQEVRAFASETMGLAKSNSYSSFVQLDRPAVTFIVTASPKTALKAYEWWFPIIGRVPYKGFFDRKDAERELAKLKRKNLDVLIEGVAAYSTLGWWSDPLLSSMLDTSPGRLAETLLHEMTHAAFYFKNDGDFNESTATFVGEQGAEDFLKKTFGDNSPELKEWRAELAEEAKEDLIWDSIYRRLSALYAAAIPESEKLSKREELFSEARSSLGLKTVNNAVVLANHRYRGDLADFHAAFERVGGNWPKMLELLRTLDKHRPREALRARIQADP